MPKVVLTEPVPVPLAQRIQAVLPAGVDFAVVPSASEADFARAVADADILLVVHRRIDAHTLALAPRVRFIQRAGAGYDNLDRVALAAAGIPVAYTPGANAVAVAEHTLLLMLALLKRLPQAEQASRADHWAANELIQAGIGDLAGATVGLVGLGTIGRAVAERLAPFGVQLLYHQRHPCDASTESRLGLHYLPLPELLAAATIVSLHLPLTPETRGLIGAAELARMQPGALLINTARGGLVDEAALRAALTSGQLGGAGLDVLAQERDGGNPFADLPQVIVTPHVAGASRASTQRILQVAVANISRFLAGAPPQDLVPGP